MVEAVQETQQFSGEEFVTYFKNDTSGLLENTSDTKVSFNIVFCL